MATMLLAAGALAPDFGDTRAGDIPLLAAFGLDDGMSNAPEVFHYAGFLSVLGFLGCFGWLCVALGQAGKNARLSAFHGRPRLPHRGALRRWSARSNVLVNSIDPR